MTTAHSFARAVALSRPSHALSLSEAHSEARSLYSESSFTMEVTVGQVAGIIAAAVFIVQFLFPNAIVLVLVCLIGNQHSAVTWSVVGRQINNSQWPILLRSDTNASRGVYSQVNGMAYLRPIGAALVAIAAIVTPLGLYDAIVPGKVMREVPFAYLEDDSPLGLGTPQQGSDIWFSRSCGGMFGLA